MKTKKEYELQTVCDNYLLIPSEETMRNSDEIISLDAISAYLWKNVSSIEKFTTETLVKLLQAEFDVDEKTAHEDCVLITETWLEMNIIETT